MTHLPADKLIVVFRCAITDRSLFPGDESQRQATLVQHATQWARSGIDFIQLRERDLPPADLAYLTTRVLSAIAAERSATRLLVNSRLSVALECGAHGMHLPSHSPLLPDDVRRRYASLDLPQPVITVSCHNLAEIHIAVRNRADAILFAPVFGKTINRGIVTPATGLEALREACLAATTIPVYALGGVTEENAPQCIAAGAQGIAGIRLFLNSSDHPR